MADDIAGIVLEIPKGVLDNIDKADKAIKQLQATSQTAAQEIKRHFDTTAVSGLNAFIQKVQTAQGILGNIKMPNIDASSFSASITQIAQAMATVDKSATTGANRISRIADSISKLSASQPSAQMFQEIANGITAIGNTSQQTITNVQMLAQTMAQLARDIRTVQNAQRAQANDTATAAQYNKLYKEQADLVRQINEIKGKGSNATLTELSTLAKIEARYREIDDQLVKLNKKKQTAASSLADWQGGLRTNNTWNRTTVPGAIDYAKQAQSLKALQDAYKNLKAVMATVDPKSKDWKSMNAVLQQTKTKIDKIRKAMGEFSSQSKQMAGIAGQLRNQLTAAFSVAAIKEYMSQMIKVRAEFELQNTALRAILQNKDEADRIFAQVQQMALQSPFTIMQLTTYTKQLAAYRIEANKLVGTTKMLADVSAGLGVDIQRLILAYGQVKSANYLRATEVRQFTEAGLNIAGELAQYFSELQGKMISVGDVMDMITKRMVRFEDVEEVFKRVTSAGGLFYDMQKKQSETLWGQLQRIQDAYSIMMNDIGKSNQGAISTMLTTIRALISNWRTVATVMKLVVGVGGGLLLVLKSINIQAKSGAVLAWVKSLWTGLQRAITAAGGLKAALMSLNFTGWGAIVAGVGLAVAAIHELISSSSALREELDRVATESMTDMYDAMYQFKEMAKTAQDATKPFNERNEAMQSLHRTFKDILPAEMLEIENLRKMTDGYKEATDAIKEFYTEAAKKKAAETIANETEQAWSTLINHLKDGAEYLQSGQSELANLPVGTIRGLIGKTMLELKQEIQNGTTDVNDAWNRFKVLFKETSGVQLEDNFSTRSFRAFFGEYTFTVADFYDDITDIVKRETEAQAEFDAQFREGFSQETQALIAEYDKRKKAVADFNTALMNYAELQQKGKLRDEKGGLTEEGRAVTQDLGAAKASMNQYLGLLGESQISWEGLKTATQNNTDALLLFDEVQQRVLGGFIQFAQKTSTDTSIQAWAERTSRELKAAGLGDLQMEIINLAKESATANGIQLTMLDQLRVSANTNYTSAAEDAHKLSKAAEDNIKRITASRIQLMALGMTAEQAQRKAESMFGNGYTEEQLKNQKDFWDKLSQLYGYNEKKKSAKGKDPWQERVSLIKEMNTEYEKLLKYYDESEAKLRVQKSYAEAVSEAFKGIKVNGKDLGDIKIWEGFDKEGMIAQLRKILDSGLTISKEKRAELQKMLAGFKATIDIEIQENRLEQLKQRFTDIFANYDLTKELGNLGVDVDLTYIVGGKPMTLAQARKELQETYDKALAEGNPGKDAEKAYKDALKKLADLEHKAQVERLKNYNKYLIESVGERAQIELKAAQDINKIRNDETLNDFSKEQAVMQRRKKMYEELTKFDFDQFKGGDVYLSVFKDLEAASKEQLTYVISKLKEMQSTFKDLSPVQVKSIANEIKKMEEALAGKDSVKNIVGNLKASVAYARKRNDLLKEQTAIQQKVDSNQKALSDAERYLIQLTQQRDAIQDKLSDEWEDANKKVGAQQSMVKQLQDRIKELEDALAKVTGEIDKGTNAWDSFKAGVSSLRTAMNDVKDSFDAVFGGLDSMGLVSDGFRDTYESISDVIGGLDTFLGGLESISITNPFSVITGSIKAVGGLFQTVGGIFSIGDKKKERQIVRLVEKVDELKKSYDTLHDSMEDAYTFDDYNAGYNASVKLLDEQKAAYEEMIRLEQAKKKTDKDKIKEYEDAIAEIEKTRKELQEARYEEYGSISEKGYKSEAEAFVSAWLDAYKETGDGLDALGEHWDDFFENLVMKQASSAIVATRMEKFIKQINAAIDSNDTGLSLSQTFAEIGKNLKAELGDWNEDLKAFFDAVGIKGGAGDLVLSDLQKGIQNITEPQAAALEAYMNSIRFAVFHHTEQLDTLITAIQAQYGGGDSPILVEVRAIRSILSNIDDRFRSITQSVTGRGLVLKVN